MDYLRRLLFNMPNTLWDVPDGVYGDMEAFLAWLESPGAAESIRAWEQRQRTTLDSIIRGLENETRHRPPSYLE